MSIRGPTRGDSPPCRPANGPRAAIIRRRLPSSYELVLMLDPEVPEDQREALAQQVGERIDGGGTIVHAERWGVRRMAYEIRHRRESDYWFWRFEGDNDLLAALDHHLKIADGVVRSRIFAVDPETPTNAPPQIQDEPGRGREGREAGRDHDDDREREPAR